MELAQQTVQQLILEREALQARVVELEKQLSAAVEEASRWGETRAFVP